MHDRNLINSILHFHLVIELCFARNHRMLLVVCNHLKYKGIPLTVQTQRDKMYVVLLL